jgi:transposase
MGGRWLSDAKIAALLEAARTSVGVRMNAWAIREMQEIAERIVELRKRIAACRRELRRLTEQHAVIQAQKPAVGLTTACVLWVCVGDPRQYRSAAAYRKAMGLNLKEQSSGQHKGKLKLSKRGQRLCRKWLYFSALRRMQHARVARWARAKKQRDGGEGLRAVIGVMRRLALAAWHVAAHGVAFDAARLFPGAAA